MMAPLWAVQLGTGAKSFMDNPLLGSPALNTLGLHECRLRLAHSLADRRRTALAKSIASEDRAIFDRDGFVVKRDFLPPELFKALVSQVKAHRGPVREMTQGNAVTRRIALDPQTLSTMPALRDTLRRPDWRGVLRYAFSYNAEPVTYLQTILSHCRPGLDDPQCDLHADTFHPTVKVWLFLTDVPEGEGPFTYVAGSHRMTPQRLAWERRRALAIADEPNRLSRRGSLRVGPEELVDMDLPPPTSVAVPANTLVVADTCGFHARGPTTKPTRRVEVWASGRRNPFLPWAGLDLWRVEALGQRRIPALWIMKDTIERLGGRKHLWSATWPYPGRAH